MHKVMIMANDTTYVYNLRKEIIQRLVNKGVEVTVVAQPLLLKDELMHLGCRIIGIESKRHQTNLISDLKLLLKYKRLLMKEKPDVVLTYNIKPNVYGGMACRMTKTHYLPNITGLGTAVEYPGLLQKITTRLYKLGIKKADCVFFQNEENRDFFINRNLLRKDARTRLLPGSGVSLDEHKVLPYPEGNNLIHFLFVARILREKGIDLYLEAAKRIHEKYPNTLFHICGQCDDMSYMGQLNPAQKGGYIIYHGEQKNMLPYFTMAHCVVHPSYYPEGMSNVLLEACAHARPIIATDRSGCREIVDDGVTGFLIPIKDEDALEKALQKFLSISWEQRRQMGVAGRKKMEKEFDREIVINAYEEEIERVFK